MKEEFYPTTKEPAMKSKHQISYNNLNDTNSDSSCNIFIVKRICTPAYLCYMGYFILEPCFATNELDIMWVHNMPNRNLKKAIVILDFPLKRVNYVLKKRI